MTGLIILLFLVGAFTRTDGSEFKVTGTGQVSPDKTKLTLQLEMVSAGGATPTNGVTPGVVPPGGVTPTVSQQGVEFEEEALKEHNKFRAIHGVPPMTLDKAMCQEAAKYAQQLAGLGGLRHSPRKQREGQGENLSMGCSSSKGQTAKEAVDNWYNEVCDPGYDFSSGSYSSGAGHFTQVVWKASTVLGIGKADGTKRGMKCTYYVARYKEAGNFLGQFKENVLKGALDKQAYCSKVAAEASFKDLSQNIQAWPENIKAKL